MIRGTKIKQRWDALSMIQQELADKLYVTIQAVSQWENGKPDSDRILLLAKLLANGNIVWLNDKENDEHYSFVIQE